MTRQLWLVAVVGGLAGGAGWGLTLLGVAAWQGRRRAGQADDEAAARAAWARLVAMSLAEARAAGLAGYVRDVGPDRVSLN